jgi:hypothetical protein
MPGMSVSSIDRRRNAKRYATLSDTTALYDTDPIVFYIHVITLLSTHTS